MPDQTRIGAHLKGAKAAFLLGPLKPFFHLPSGKRNLHQRFQLFFRRRIADKIFDLAGVSVVGDNQPIGAICRYRTMGLAVFVPDQIDLRRFDMPDTLAACCALDHHFSPGLAIKRRTVRGDLVGAMGGMFGTI